MADLLASQLNQLAFAVITGQCRLTDDQRLAIADLNAACAVAATPPGVGSRTALTLVSHTKEPA